MRPTSVLLISLVAALASGLNSTIEDDPYAVLQVDQVSGEYLQQPEALIQGEAEQEGAGEEEEEVALLEDVVAEQLIQVLDDIGKHLDDKDDSTPGESRPVQSADLNRLDHLLIQSGLTQDSDLMQKMTQKNRNMISSLIRLGALDGHGTDGRTGLIPILAPGMTKKNVEEVKKELQEMLFGPDAQQVPFCLLAHTYLFTCS